jgi:hypothetical protein
MQTALREGDAVTLAARNSSDQEWVKEYGQWLYDRRGGWAHEKAVPRFLYKYYRPERVHVLRDCSVRFSQRTVFEDERELRPDVASWGTEEEIRAYMQFDPWSRSLPTWLKELVLQRILLAPGWQARMVRNTQSSMTAPDEFGIFCLCEQPNSDQMWSDYAQRTGFVVAFDATHGAFDTLRTPGTLGKVTYSDEPLGTFLGSHGPDAFFRKRAKYEFECEWRSIRALHRLDGNGEHDGHPVFVSRFDPACITEILVRPDCSVRQQLDDLLTMDVRYRHVTLRQV